MHKSPEIHAQTSRDGNPRNPEGVYAETARHPCNSNLVLLLRIATPARNQLGVKQRDTRNGLFYAATEWISEGSLFESNFLAGFFCRRYLCLYPPGLPFYRNRAQHPLIPPCFLRLALQRGQYKANRSQDSPPFQSASPTPSAPSMSGAKINLRNI